MAVLDLGNRVGEFCDLEFRRSGPLFVLRSHVNGWMSQHGVRSTIILTPSGKVLLHISDPAKATLFKLTWM